MRVRKALAYFIVIVCLSAGLVAQEPQNGKPVAAVDPVGSTSTNCLAYSLDVASLPQPEHAFQPHSPPPASVGQQFPYAATGVTLLFGDGAAGDLAILILGDGFDTQSSLVEVAWRDVSYLLALEPFQARAEKISVYLLEKTRVPDLGCWFPPAVEHSIDCNPDTVVNTARAASIRGGVDEILVIYNTTRYGGGGRRPSDYDGLYSYAVAYAGPWSPQVVAHEFGHSFGNLADECDSSPYQPPAVNCVLNPAEQWADIPGMSLTRYRGCAGRSDYFRDDEDDLMRTTAVNHFGPVDQRELLRRIPFVGE